MTTPAGSFSFAYDLLGRRTALTYPHGVVGSYSYDETHQLNWLTGISYTSSSGELLSVVYPLHDNVGNRLQRSEDGDSVDYSYDAVYQVTAAQSSLDDEGFSYDAVGNRTAGPSATDSYTHNAANQMTQGGELSFAYDERGNQSYRYLNSAQTDYWHYSWNAEKQLIQAELTEAGTTVRTLTFAYDAFGRRMEKQITENGTTKTTSYVYDGEDILLSIDNDGSTTTATYFIHGPGIDEPLAMVKGGSSHYYHADGLGSIVAITDSSQTIVQHYDYDTFGQLTASDDFANGYTFTGREWDDELGLYYYRARYYDAQIGRFISKDPIGFAGGDVNIYRYVGNQPVNWLDPFGFSAWSHYWSGVHDRMHRQRSQIEKITQKHMYQVYDVISMTPGYDGFIRNWGNRTLEAKDSIRKYLKVLRQRRLSTCDENEMIDRKIEIYENILRNYNALDQLVPSLILWPPPEDTYKTYRIYYE